MSHPSTSAPAPTTTTTTTAGLHHLGLTVSDCQRVAAFFVENLGFKIVREVPSYPAVFVSDGTVMLTLWQVQTTTGQAFDRKSNVGLHHFALRLAAGQDLDQVFARLQHSQDVVVEFGPEKLGAGGARHLMLSVCGSFRMEIIDLPA